MELQDDWHMKVENAVNKALVVSDALSDTLMSFGEIDRLTGYLATVALLHSIKTQFIASGAIQVLDQLDRMVEQESFKELLTIARRESKHDNSY